MVGSFIFVCFLILFYFLVVELIAARKWKYLTRTLGHYGFDDEYIQNIINRDHRIAKENKWFQIDWLHPTNDLRKIRKLGFIRMPVHIQFGMADEMWEHTSPYYRGKILGIEGFDENWKDKDRTPRFETSPHIYITIFNTFAINIVWSFYYNFGTPREERYDNDQYWEQALWCLYYCDGDIEKGRETWPWSCDGVSTWDEKYLRKKYRRNK
jgi:hypothetical protein